MIKNFLTAISIGFCLCLIISTPASADLIHQYTLNGTTADTFGGPNMVLPNPSNLGSTDYTFEAYEGPNVSGAIDADTYSIEMLFSLTADNIGYQKIIDFHNRDDDDGMYVYDDYFYFYSDNISTPDIISPSFVAGDPLHLVVTRDDITSEFSAYFNNEFLWSFIDTEQDAVFSGLDNIIHLLIDDTDWAGDDAAGFLDFVKIYDNALTAQEVASLTRPETAPVPEPTTMLLLGAGLVGLAGFRRKFKK